MQIIDSPQRLNRLIHRLKCQGKTIGFVPTMGALHEGHLSLMRRCRRENNLSVISIFVNPKQFGPKEDLAKYPREKDADVILAKKSGVNILFYPSQETMYPKGFLTHVEVARLSDILCGNFRPGHFRGVTTVVAKLLNIVSPDVMYLGEKDIQQAIILKRMVADLNFPTRIRICPTVREKDGLALSSRNRYLTTEERQQARAIYRSLTQAKYRIKEGERLAATVTGGIRSLLCQETRGRIDYVACVDARTLAPVRTIKERVILAVAIRFRNARLIDNIAVNVP